MTPHHPVFGFVLSVVDNKPSLHQDGSHHGVKPECEPESLGGLAEAQVPGLTPRVSDLMGLGYSLKNCISNTFPGAAAAGLCGTLSHCPIPFSLFHFPFSF